MSISLVQTITATGNSADATASFASATTAGNLLVAVVTFPISGAPATPYPSGWTYLEAYDVSLNQVIFYYPNNPGSVGSVTVLTPNYPTTDAWVISLYEFSGLPTTTTIQAGPNNVNSGNENYVSGSLASVGLNDLVLFIPACTSTTSWSTPSGFNVGAIPTGSYVSALFWTTASATSYSVTTNISAVVGGQSIMLSFMVASAPNAPTLTTPANGAYLDVTLAGNNVFAGTYNSTDGANANARAMRIKASSASSYNYLNVSTNALQSTIVWNTVNIAPGASGSFTVPGLSNGVTDNWSMADQESLANLEGPFASDFSVNFQLAPNLSINSPTGSETTTNAPSLSYTPTPASGAVVTGGRWLIYPLSVTQASGFSIDIATSTIPAGAVSDVSWTGNPLTVAIQSGVTLNNSSGYVAYAAITETGSEWSSTISSSFTISPDQAATPTVTAVAEVATTTTPPYNAVTVQAHDNILSTDDANTSSTLGTLIAGTNTAIALSTAEVLGGPYSVSLTSAAAGAMSMATSATAYAVEPSTDYTIMSWYMAAATAESCRTDVAWYTSAGVLISTTQGTTITDSTSGWTPSIASVTSPSNAAYAQLIDNVLNTAAASEVHYSAQRGIQPGITGNLVYDSDLTNAIATTGATWQFVPTIGTSPGDWNVVNAGTPSAAWQFIGTGSWSAYQGPASQLFDVTPGESYMFSLTMEVPTGTTGLGAFGFQISSSNLGNATNTSPSAIGINQLSTLYTVPAGVTRLLIQPFTYSYGVVPLGEIMTWSNIQVTQTDTVQPYQPGPLWTRGGLVGSTTATVVRSDGLYVRGAYASAPAAIPTPSQTLVVNDYEATPGVAYTYTAVVSDTLSANAVISSPASAASNAVTVNTTAWWIFDPTNVSSATEVVVLSINITQIEQSAAHYPIGQGSNITYGTVISSGFNGHDGTASLQVFTAAAYTALGALFTSGKTLFLSSMFGDSYYIRVGPQPGGMSSGVGNVARSAALLASTTTNPTRTMNITWIAQPRP